MTLPPGPWTEADLARLPDDGRRYEIIDGTLVVTPHATDDHHEIAEDILALLHSAAPPGWRPIRAIGVRVADDILVTPDLTVVRPGTPREMTWTDPSDVALVVEVESPHSRRVDRCLKPSLYAEAGIESYWRVERHTHGPAAHLYDRPCAGRYDLHRCVVAGRVVTAELPYAVQVAPATWAVR